MSVTVRDTAFEWALSIDWVRVYRFTVRWENSAEYVIIIIIIIISSSSSSSSSSMEREIKIISWEQVFLYTKEEHQQLRE
jgi:hypothetical protein